MHQVCCQEIPMHVVRLDPIEGARKGIDERMRKLGDENMNV
jgi:hypothetical protein